MMNFFKNTIRKTTISQISNHNGESIVTINGMTYRIPNANNIAVVNSKIFVDGVEFKTDETSNPNNIVTNITVIINGDVGKVDSCGSVEVNGTVRNGIDCGGSVTVTGDVNGGIDSGGSITIRGNHEGDIDAGGSVSIR